MVKIIGVDYSGAQTDKNTWITRAELTVDTPENGTLEIKESASIKRADLVICLKDLPDGAVAALDFPFSVPIDFANYLGQSSVEMPQLWDCVANMCLDKFIEKRNEFVGVDKVKEYLRIGDLQFAGPFSCLHDTNPNMVPMTFYGMKMLHQLWQCNRFEIPPLKSAKDNSPVLLEVMPGVALAKYKLLPKYKGYKSTSKKVEAKEKRSRIFEELSTVLKSRLTITGDKRTHIQEQCEKSDDCLDSVVASAVAALWAMDKNGTGFRHPTDCKVPTLNRKRSKRQASPQVIKEHLTEQQAARREGWIYAPKRH